MKKRILLALAALLAGFQLLTAIPARPGKFSVTQPDGSRLVLERHGDEWGHWLTDASGNIVRKDADGFYRIVSEEDASSLRETAARRRTVITGPPRARRSPKSVAMETPAAPRPGRTGRPGAPKAIRLPSGRNASWSS